MQLLLTKTLKNLKILFSIFGLTENLPEESWPSLGTLEIRALRSQKNAKVLALITELLDRRIQYTNSHPRDEVS